MHSPKKVGVLKPTTEIPVLDQNRECSSCAEAVGFIARPFASLRYHQHVTPVSDEFKVNCRYQGDFAKPLPRGILRFNRGCHDGIFG